MVQEEARGSDRGLRVPPGGAQPSSSPSSWGTPDTSPSTPLSLQFLIYRMGTILSPVFSQDLR